MAYKNYTVYDNDDFFKRYTEKRAKGNSPNELIEQPIFNELIGNPDQKKILDLGCGDALYGQFLLEQNCASYLGVEGSSNMYQLALKHISNYPKAQILHKDIQAFDYPPNAFDLVISRLVFHYIEDLKPLFEKIFLSLKPQGQFIFSVEHPIITSCYRAYHQEGKRQDWIVDNYFDSGKRINTWIGQHVIKYHRTLEAYFKLAKSTGFDLDNLRESKPQRIHFASDEDFQRRMRIPLFLFFKLSKEAD